MLWHSRCEGWMHAAEAMATPKSYVPVEFVWRPGLSTPFASTLPKYSEDTCLV
jgi:hypothetical protein